MLARFDHRTPTWFPIHVWGSQLPTRRSLQRQRRPEATPNAKAEAKSEIELNIRFDVHESKDAYVLTADVPGVKQSDLDITVEEKSITVSGERKDASGEESTLRSRERRHGRFSRTFRLRDSVNADAIPSVLSNGVLTLTVPKSAEAQPRTIPVTVK